MNTKYVNDLSELIDLNDSGLKLLIAYLNSLRTVSVEAFKAAVGSSGGSSGGGSTIDSATLTTINNRLSALEDAVGNSLLLSRKILNGQ